MFAASSVYLALKVSLTVSASIPVAVLSITIFEIHLARAATTARDDAAEQHGADDWLRRRVNRRRHAEERDGPRADSGPGVLIASGLIAGGAIPASVLAALQPRGLDAAIDLSRSVGSSRASLAMIALCRPAGYSGVRRRALATIAVGNRAASWRWLEASCEERRGRCRPDTRCARLARSPRWRGPAGAQRRTGSLAGIVRDDGGVPIANVEVTAVKQATRRAHATASADSFSPRSPPARSI